MSYYLNNARKTNIARLAQGTSVLHLYADQLAALTVNIPISEEQSKIAGFLMAVDKRIELLRKKKKQLEQYKKGIMQKIFSLEIRFKDDDGRDFPDWEEKSLGEIGNSFSYGMNASSGKYNGEDKYIRITDINEKTRNYDPKPLTSPAGKINEKFRLKKGDMLFVRTGASVGKTYIYDEKDGRLYYGGFLIKVSIDKANPKFVFYTTLCQKYDKWVRIMSVRSGQPGINAREYKNSKVTLPSSLLEQSKITNFLLLIDQAIETLEKQKEKTKKWKNGLLQRMFV